MAAEKSICINYAGREKLKIFPQSKNSKLLVSNLLSVNGLKILNSNDCNGYTQFKCKNKKTKKHILLNIFFANFKFDLERPNFVNINLGSKIDNPYELSTQYDANSLTIILGIYVFDENDTIDNALFVKCPIKQRKYSGNPSLRANIQLIKEARIHSDASWKNNAGDTFRAFKPLAFSNVINLSNIGQASKLSPNQTSILSRKNIPGPPPSKKSYIVDKKNNKNGVVYVARWGQTDLWKIGTTTDTKRRIKEFNQYIPFHEIPNHDIWTLILAKEFSSPMAAYNIEQKILNDSKLIKFNTSGERFQCPFDLIQETINTYAL